MPRPNLENLRKQAKRFARWHAAGHIPVAAMLREALPRCADLDDAAILAAPFTLAEAQQVAAVAHGYPSWQAARLSAEQPDSAPSSAAVPEIIDTEAQLLVTDLPRSLAFFDRLGFTEHFQYGQPPFYAQVRRGAGVVNLRVVTQPVFLPEVRAADELIAVTFTVGSADALRAMYGEALAAEVDVHQPLRSEPWGSRTFVLLDPDDNLLLFASPR